MNRPSGDTSGTRSAVLSARIREWLLRVVFAAGAAVILLTPATGIAAVPDSSRTLVLGSGAHRYFLATRIDVLEDREKRLSIGDVTDVPFSGLFLPNKKKALHLGINDSAWWLRFTVADSEVSDSSSPAPRWILSIPWPHITSVRFFAPKTDSTGITRWDVTESSDTGYRVPGNHPAIVPVFTLPRPLGKPRTFYLRVESTSALYLPLEICSRGAYLNNAKLKMFWIGIFSGVITALSLYNMFLFVSLRDRSYLWYVSYVAFLGLFFLGFLGLTREYLFPGMPEAAAKMIFASIGVAMIGAGLFSRTFLGMRETMRTMDRALRILMGVTLAATLCVPLLGIHLLSDLFCILCTIFPFVFIGAGIERLRDGFLPARFFLAGWVVYTISGIWFLATFLGVLILPVWGFPVFQTGAAIHAVFLSFALADRIRTIQHEREAARRSERRYQELALTDGLTGLYNARFFRSRIGQEIEWAESTRLPLSLLLLDVDNFKRFNDTWGHPEGDRVLARLGQTILAQTREDDMGCRYGGEEFAVILRGISGAAADEVADRIRSAFASEPFTPETDRTVFVTVSIGVADHIPGRPAASLVERADRVLYEAKNTGKNRVVRERTP